MISESPVTLPLSHVLTPSYTDDLLLSNDEWSLFKSEVVLSVHQVAWLWTWCLIWPALLHGEHGSVWPLPEERLGEINGLAGNRYILFSQIFLFVFSVFGLKWKMHKWQKKGASASLFLCGLYIFCCSTTSFGGLFFYLHGTCNCKAEWGFFLLFLSMNYCNQALLFKGNIDTKKLAYFQVNLNPRSDYKIFIVN